MVDYYGTPTPINQMGTVSSPEPLSSCYLAVGCFNDLSRGKKQFKNPISASIRRTTASSFALFSPNLPRNAAKSLLKSSAKKPRNPKLRSVQSAAKQTKPSKKTARTALSPRMTRRGLKKRLKRPPTMPLKKLTALQAKKRRSFLPFDEHTRLSA